MATNAGRGGRAPPGKEGGAQFDEESATRKSGRWGAEEPSYGESEPARKHDRKKPNPEGPEYEEGGAYPGRPYDSSPESLSSEQRSSGERPSDERSRADSSPRSMREPDALGKPHAHEAGKQEAQKRTVGNHPADPNRMGADWNLLPPGISDEDVRDPGGMKEPGRPGGRGGK